MDTDLLHREMSDPIATVDLLWIPLGGPVRGARPARLFEKVLALAQRRPTYDLCHSALAVTVPTGRSVIEMHPSDRMANGEAWSVRVASQRRGWAISAVPVREIRRWREASSRTKARRFHGDRGRRSGGAERLLDLVSSVPTPVWVPDELGAGESGTRTQSCRGCSRGPESIPRRSDRPRRSRSRWDAGLVVAARDPDRAVVTPGRRRASRSPSP